jgi:phosphoenolpyruvate carboxykinase (GTP)
VDTAIGRLPAPGSLDIGGLGLTERQLNLLMTVDPEVWAEEAALIPDHYALFGDHLPAELWEEHAALTRRLGLGPTKPRLEAANSDQQTQALSATA